MTEAAGRQPQPFDHSIPHQTPETGIEAQNGSMIGEGGSRKVTCLSGSNGANGSSIMNDLERMASHSTEVAENPMATGGDAFAPHVTSGKMPHHISPNLTGKVSDDTSDETNEVMKKQILHVTHGHDDRIELSSSEKAEPIVTNQEEPGVQESPEELGSQEEDDILSNWGEAIDQEDTAKDNIESSGVDSTVTTEELLNKAKIQFNEFGSVSFETSPKNVVLSNLFKVYIPSERGANKVDDFLNFSPKSNTNIFIFDPLSGCLFCSSSILNDKNAIKTMKDICKENNIDPSKLNIVILSEDHFHDLAVDFKNFMISSSNVDEEKDSKENEKRMGKERNKPKNIEVEHQKIDVKEKEDSKTLKHEIQVSGNEEKNIKEFIDHKRDEKKKFEEAEEEKQVDYNEKMNKIIRSEIEKESTKEDDIKKGEQKKEAVKSNQPPPQQ
ncbi:MAG: hypothetical protein JSR46_11345 [Verrucomicrobia bacterium]|nr:hypothetical protein [Verrucomicrobiota bacterium]